MHTGNTDSGTRWYGVRYTKMGVGTGGGVDMCTGEVVRAWRMGKGNKGVVRASVRWGRVHLTVFPKAVLGMRPRIIWSVAKTQRLRGRKNTAGSLGLVHMYPSVSMYVPIARNAIAKSAFLSVAVNSALTGFPSSVKCNAIGSSSVK